MRSDDFKECDNCDFTSSTEAEEGALEAKRRRKNKTFEDCVTELELPAAPRKLEHVQERESPVRSEYASSPSSSTSSRRSSSGSTVIPLIRGKQISRAKKGFSANSGAHIRNADQTTIS
ncbi:uncharacterized protein LOC119914851 isoform X2 [Micropterus salmoides]|uniref:uncharacterized protein LOC119914851 isoform X2 n=1 Tax=Micropterus salmoides TaxID=27706 RepID=UPI0018EE16F9|nr:uncharacterized protein LOC119914851 isoform X2 [Micropterus salmoides]